MEIGVVCANCGRELEERACKVRCAYCGYFEDCSDPSAPGEWDRPERSIPPSAPAQAPADSDPVSGEDS